MCFFTVGIYSGSKALSRFVSILYVRFIIVLLFKKVSVSSGERMD